MDYYLVLAKEFGRPWPESNFKSRGYRTRVAFWLDRNLRVDPLAPHDPHAGAPVLVNIEAINLNVRRNRPG